MNLKTPDIQIYAAGFFDTIAKMKFAEKDYALKKQETMDMAIINLLSTELGTVRQNIKDYDDWLVGERLYNLVPEEDRTAEFNTIVDSLREGKIDDYEDLGDLLEARIETLSDSMITRKEIKSDHIKGQNYRKYIDDKFANLIDEDFMLSGEVVLDESGEPEFTNESEIEALFNPRMIQLDLNHAKHVLAAGSEIDPASGKTALEESSLPLQGIDTLPKLEQYIADKEAILFNLEQAGVSTTSGLDEEVFRSEAFVSGFDKGQRTAADIEAKKIRDIQYESALFKHNQGLYDEAQKGYILEADQLGETVNARMKINAAGVQYSIQDLINLAGNPETQERYGMIMNTISNKYPNGFSVLQRILDEAMNTAAGVKIGSYYDEQITAASDIYQLNQKMGLILSEIKDKADTAKLDISAYINNNKDTPLVQEYIKSKKIVDDLRSIGLSIESLGTQITADAFRNRSALKQINIDEITELNAALGFDSQLGRSSILETQQNVDILSAFSESGGDDDGDTPDLLSTLNIGPQTQRAYETSREDLITLLDSSQDDEKMDIISDLLGIPKWETFSDLDSYINYANQSIDNRFKPGDKINMQMKSRLKRLLGSIGMGPIEDLDYKSMLDQYTGRAYQGYAGAMPMRQHERDPSWSDLPSFYQHLDEIKESLNTLSVLGTLSPDMEEGAALVQKTRIDNRLNKNLPK